MNSMLQGKGFLAAAVMVVAFSMAFTAQASTMPPQSHSQQPLYFYSGITFPTYTFDQMVQGYPTQGGGNALPYDYYAHPYNEYQQPAPHQQPRQNHRNSHKSRHQNPQPQPNCQYPYHQIGQQCLPYDYPATQPQGPAASIDRSSLTSSNAQPTLTGTATGVTGLWVLIGTQGGGENDTAMLGTTLGNVTMSGSRWSATVNSATLSPGTYVVHIYDQNQYGGKQNLLTSGTLTIGSNASCLGCTKVPFVSSISPSSGPVGTQVTLTGSGFIQGQTSLIGSPIWSSIPYTVSNHGTKLTLTVPSMAIQEFWSCSGGGSCPDPTPTPVEPGAYTLSLSTDGNVGQSSPVTFTVTR